MVRPRVALAAFALAAFAYGGDVFPLGDRLHAAVRAGNLAETQKLLAAGADVNARDALGGTPLLDAAWAGNLEITNFLLSRGADVNARHSEAGSTALEYAVLTDRPAIVRALLDAKARADLQYKDGQSVLHAAAS